MTLSLGNLHRASFKGVPFYITGDELTTSFGSKTVKHEYPNSNIRYVQNLGRMPRDFTVIGIVHGDSYLSDRDDLLNVLEDGTIGILNHPFYGIRTVVLTTGTIDENISDLGVARITMNFSTSSLPVLPGISAAIDSLIIAATDFADGSITSGISNLFNVSPAFPNNYFSASDKMQSVNSNFDSFKTNFNTTQDFSNLNVEQEKFTNNLNDNLRDPASLSKSMSDLFAVANGSSDDPKKTGYAFTQLFDFGTSDNPVGDITRQGKERNKNTHIINYSFNAFAYIYACMNYSQAVFSDDLELQQIYNILEAQYIKIINGEVTDSMPVDVVDILGVDTINHLENVRNLTRQKFDDDALNIAKITTINIKETPVSVISYLYYENTDQDQEIINLNNIKDVSFISGEIKVAIKPRIAA